MEGMTSRSDLRQKPKQTLHSDIRLTQRRQCSLHLKLHVLCHGLPFLWQQ